jgi:hypothetical protein
MILQPRYFLHREINIRSGGLLTRKPTVRNRPRPCQKVSSSSGQLHVKAAGLLPTPANTRRVHDHLSIQACL